MENSVRDERFYQHTLESTLGIPFSDGNEIKILRNGEEIFPEMLQAIREAEDQIELLTFIYWKGDIAFEFAEALSQKAREGVRVRVILDSVGASFMPEKLSEMMSNNGVQIEWFRPVAQWKIWKTDNRTHRKVLICDVNVAFTGGVGIAEEWEGDARNPSEWRETHFKIKGPAVFGLYAAFMENWIETGRSLELESLWEERKRSHRGGDNTSGLPVQVIRTSASVRWSDIVMLYQTLIKMAQKNITITTAYFNPDQTILDLLIDTSRQGVDIDVMIPGKHLDHRVANIVSGQYFDDLMNADIRLWFYQKTMLHAKTIVVDDLVCCVGSANFNHRSMLKDDEINIIIIDSDLAAHLHTHFEEDLTFCEKIEPGRWKNRSIFRKGVEKLAGSLKQEV